MNDLLEKPPKISVNLKPRKSVIATTFVPKGKLVLVPAALNIKAGLKKPDEALFSIRIQHPETDIHIWLQSAFVIPKAEGDPGFFSPAFLVQPLIDESECNTEGFYAKSSRCKNVSPSTPEEFSRLAG